MKMLPVLPAQTPAGTMHTDPVCGMKVREETAAGSDQFGGERYFFCNLNSGSFSYWPPRLLCVRASPIQQLRPARR